MTDEPEEPLIVDNGASTYCLKHRRCYKADAGCPICAFEEGAAGGEGGVARRVQRCPVCGEMSLFWYQCSNRCECLNLDCKLKCAEADY